MKDQLPEIEGVRDLWGHGVFPCPYCDGWEVKDEPLAALGNGTKALTFALLLSKWSRSLVLCTNGPAELDSQARALLAKLGIEVRETALKRVEGKIGSLKLHFSDGRTLDRRALFFHAPRTQSSDLAQQLGCEMSEGGAVAVNAMGQTTVPGVYAAGDLAHPAGLPFPPAFVIVAAAQGAIARGRDRQRSLDYRFGIAATGTSRPKPESGLAKGADCGRLVIHCGQSWSYQFVENEIYFCRRLRHSLI